ncbi:MAG: hypothetical protein NDI90_11120 [Nitrospira sp. BO4]|jgi:hypothetical protein|nr:hypothetical protein [Nitrospira sp. BO4]
MSRHKEKEYCPGVLQKVHVDKSTKLDTVKTGDVVKAYVTEQGHATTLQRDN